MHKSLIMLYSIKCTLYIVKSDIIWINGPSLLGTNVVQLSGVHCTAFQGERIPHGGIKISREGEENWWPIL